MDLGLKAKNVLVTGGSKGIGLAVAELFADEGANVAICARNADEVAKVVTGLAGKGVKAWGQGVDVADPVALKGWVEGAASELGGIDCIVCNVSALAVGDTPETWEKSFRTDMMHTVNSVAAALHGGFHSLDTTGEQLVVLTLIQGVRGQPGRGTVEQRGNRVSGRQLARLTEPRAGAEHQQ